MFVKVEETSYSNFEQRKIEICSVRRSGKCRKGLPRISVTVTVTVSLWTYTKIKWENNALRNKSYYFFTKEIAREEVE